ncbi:hypothetical protein H9P43_002041 [Blastocladiella emersonii ATCC 22665]|nr:hypothetical protein H9P43_002041 [Blastocladiella emersonii ATCC 22665]
MCHADAVIQMVRTAPDVRLHPGSTDLVYNFIHLTETLERLWVESNGAVTEVSVLFPEDGKVYKVYLGATREPSEFSNTCASIYVADRYAKGWSNFTTWYNTQFREEYEFVGTISAAFKLCRSHARAVLYDANGKRV